MNKNPAKTFLIIAIMLLIAAVHIFSPFRSATGEWRSLYASYFSDLVVPFGFYFLLCASETNLPVLRPWWIKAGLVFGIATSAEILQAFSIYALGITFDPLDIVAYAAGVAVAVLVERGLFSRWLPFWQKT